MDPLLRKKYVFTGRPYFRRDDVLPNTLPAEMQPWAKRVFYVDSSLGDDGGSGTESSPWRTAARVSQLETHPGDRILFRRGMTFDGPMNIRVGGGDRGFIVIGSYGHQDAPAPIIYAGWAETSPVMISGAKGVVLRDLDVQGGRVPLMVQNSRRILIQNVTVSESIGVCGIQVRTMISAPSFFEIVGCTMTNLKGDGLLVMGQTGIKVRDCVAYQVGGCGFAVKDTYGAVIDGCLAYGCGMGGIYLNGSGCSGCVVNFCETAMNCSKKDGAASIELRGVGSMNTVSRCWCLGGYKTIPDTNVPPSYRFGGRKVGTIGIGIFGSPTGFDDRINESADNVLAYNVVAWEDVGLAVHSHKGVSVMHNTAYGCGRGLFGIRSEGIGFMNNVVSSCDDEEVKLEFCEYPLMDRNCYWGGDEDVPPLLTYQDENGNSICPDLSSWRTVVGGEPGSFVGDPLLEDPSENEFTPRPSSPCIDAASETTWAGGDALGNPVPHGDGPDIGALENQGDSY